MRNLRIPQVFTLIRNIGHEDEWEQFGNKLQKRKELNI